MKKAAYLHLCVPVLWLASLTAQTPAPLGALRAPDSAAWTIRFEYPGSPPSESGGAAEARMNRLLTTSVQKNNNVYYEVATYENGARNQKWVLPGIQFYLPAGGKEVIRLLPTDGYASDYTESDFPELGWVASLTPTSRRVEGQPILAVEIAAADRPLNERQKRARDDMERSLREFAAQTTGGDSSQAERARTLPTLPQPQGMLRVYLDPATKLPLRFESAEETRIYSFKSDLAPLQPPNAFKEAYEKWKADREASLRPASRP